MSDSKYDIIFRGDIIAGNNIVDVKQRLSQLFKIDAAKVDALFTGKATPLKKNVDLETAEKYKAVLSKAGAQVSIKNISEQPSVNTSQNVSKQVPAVKAAVSSDSELSSSTQSSKKPLTMRERLAQAAIEEEAAAKAKAAAEKARQAQVVLEGGFELAPVGAVLGVSSTHSKAEQNISIDVSHLSVKSLEGDLLTADEKSPHVIVNIDVSALDIAEIGADLVAASERIKQDISPVQVGDFGIAAVGADLLTAAEKPVVPIVEIAEASFDIAPAGSDMGQAKKPSPPPPPDTSSISLAD